MNSGGKSQLRIDIFTNPKQTTSLGLRYRYNDFRLFYYGF